MSMAPIDDNVLDKKPEHKKKTELLKPWFNWWLMSNVVSVGPILIAISSTMSSKTREDTPYASKDVATTAAQDRIAKHNSECGCGGDLGDNYLGAYEEGKSPP